jgi:transcriptional regulator with XRE-family HTH domain
MNLNSFLRELGANIAYYRKAAFLNQLETASRTGMSYRYYQKIEAGGANITFATLLRIAKFFGVHPRDLLPDRT